MHIPIPYFTVTLDVRKHFSSMFVSAAETEMCIAFVLAIIFYSGLDSHNTGKGVCR